MATPRRFPFIQDESLENVEYTPDEHFQEYERAIRRQIEADEPIERIYCEATVKAENFDRSLPHKRGPDGNAMVRPDKVAASRDYAKRVYAEADAQAACLTTKEHRTAVKKRVLSLPTALQAIIAGQPLDPICKE